MAINLRFVKDVLSLALGACGHQLEVCERCLEFGSKYLWPST